MAEDPRLDDWEVSRWFNTCAPLSLGQLCGRVVLLHTFQMLCPGCVAHSLPQAERVHREYQDLGLSVVGLHTVFEHHAAMQPVALEAFLHEYRISHPVGVDATGKQGDPIPRTMRRYRLRGTPSLLLIDRAGRLRLSQFGPLDDLHLGLWLGRLLAEPAAALREAGQARRQVSPADACDEQACRSERQTEVGPGQ